MSEPVDLKRLLERLVGYVGPGGQTITFGDRSTRRMCEDLTQAAAAIRALIAERDAAVDALGVKVRAYTELFNASGARATTAEKRVAAYEAALDPNETKAVYIGEVKDAVVCRDEDGDEMTIQHSISWTATKEIMAMIRRQALGQEEGRSDG